jgi:hypothetical protein
MFQPFFIDLHALDNLPFFEWLNQKSSLCGSFFFQLDVEVHNLLVIFSLTQRTGFNEATEVVRMRELVDKADAFCCIAVCSELFEVKEIPRVCEVRHSTVCQAWIL